MPRNPINYSRTIIYKIVCKDVNITECYVGQTTDFKSRKKEHKSTCNNINDKNYTIYIYQFIRGHNGWTNWDMVEIEKYNATDKLDAKKRERYWIEQLQATLNKQLPTRTGQEYYEEHKDKIKEYRKEYYELNKDKILECQKEYSKEYYEKNKDKIKEIKSTYREQNKDKIKENSKEYREKNRDKIKEQINCICGVVCSKNNLKRHERTNKHIEFVKTI
jgi:hypothetical protein